MPVSGSDENGSQRFLTEFLEEVFFNFREPALLGCNLARFFTLLSFFKSP
jgi:hypothetical protein